MDSDLKPLTWLQNIDILGQCGIEASRKKSLVDLNDPTDYRTTDAKPPSSYSSLITKAIKTTPQNKMTLSQIYNWIRENHLYYQKADPAWQNSIRHNLSLNKCFVKIPRPKTEPGKGGFWSLDESLVGRCGTKRKKKKKAKTTNFKDQGDGGSGNSNSSREQVRRMAKALRLEAWEKSSVEDCGSSGTSGVGCESISFILNDGEEHNNNNNSSSEMMVVDLPHLENNNDAKMADNNMQYLHHHHHHHEEEEEEEEEHGNSILVDDVTCGFSLTSNDQAMANFNAALNAAATDDHHHQHGKLASGHEIVLGNGHHHHHHMDLSDDSETGINPQLNGLVTSNGGIINNSSSSSDGNTIVVSPEDSCLDICQDVFITSHEEIVESEIIDSQLILENVYWESVLDLDHLISIGEL